MMQHIITNCNKEKEPYGAKSVGITDFISPGFRLYRGFEGNHKLSKPQINRQNAGFESDLRIAYQILITYKQEFIEKCKEFFRPEYNNLQVYNYYRFVFNEMKHERLSPARKQSFACLFVYLNLIGADSLLRTDTQGNFNLQYGDHKSVNFPEQELLALIENGNSENKDMGGECDFRDILYANYCCC